MVNSLVLLTFVMVSPGMSKSISRLGPSGNPVASCTKNGANYKIVQFNPGDEDGPGTYTVKVYVYAATGGGRTTNYGISWR